MITLVCEKTLSIVFSLKEGFTYQAPSSAQVVGRQAHLADLET